jgi:hypothetical protein
MRLIKKFVAHTKAFFLYILFNPYFLCFYGYLRYLIFKFFFGYKIINSTYSIESSNEHNLDGLDKIVTSFFMKRFDYLISALISIERIDKKNDNLLVIGPRSESDIIKLKATGFQNIKAIDLITYSPLVDLMDAHKITYPENHFDIIFCGWVLPYSQNPKLIAENIIKVAKNNSIILIGLEFSENEKINSVKKILEIFEPHVFNVYFAYDAELKKNDPKKMLEVNKLHSSQVLTVFSIKK